MAEKKPPTDCSGCGACCMGQNLLPLFGSAVDGTRLPPELAAGLDVVQTGPLRGDDGCPCIWLDRLTGECRHHDFRPSNCRILAVGGGECLRIRAGVGL